MRTAHKTPIQPVYKQNIDYKDWSSLPEMNFDVLKGCFSDNVPNLQPEPLVWFKGGESSEIFTPDCTTGAQHNSWALPNISFPVDFLQMRAAAQRSESYHLYCRYVGHPDK